MKAWLVLVAGAALALALEYTYQCAREDDSPQLERHLRLLEERMDQQDRREAPSQAPTRGDTFPLATVQTPVGPPARGPEVLDGGAPPISALDFDSTAAADHLESVFHAESPEPDWAVPAQERLRGHMAALLPEGSAITSLGCGSTLCRMEIRHESEADYQEFQRRSWENGPLWKEGAQVTIRKPGLRAGDILTFSYFARAGRTLPLVP